MRTIAEINDKIAKKTAVVWTVEELKSRVSEILNRKRKLTLEMIRKLNEVLGIPTEVLVKEY